MKGILSLGGGAAIKKILADFGRAGYLVELHLVNMADYGVPQHRQRVIIIGQRRDIGGTMRFRFPKPTNAKGGSGGLRPWRTIRDALERFPDPDKPNETVNHVYSAYKLAYRNFTGHRPTDPDKPCPTILA